MQTVVLLITRTLDVCMFMCVILIGRGVIECTYKHMRKRCTVESNGLKRLRDSLDSIIKFGFE